MALFSTPSLLDLIWRRDIYPEQGGDMGAGLIGGFGDMLGGFVGKMGKKAPAPAKSTQHWGTVGQSSTASTPGSPQQSGGGGGGGGGRQPDIPSTMAPASNTPTVPQAGGTTSMLNSPGMEIIRRALYGING